MILIIFVEIASVFELMLTIFADIFAELVLMPDVLVEMASNIAMILTIFAYILAELVLTPAKLLVEMAF